MAMNVARKLIRDHLVDGEMIPGTEIGLRIDQTLTQDATGTLVMLELEAFGLDRVQTELSAQYIDHNLIQADFKNPDDHLFLQSASQRFGLWFSRPGNGVSHPIHMQHLGVPGKSLLGSDSHTCAAGSLGMLAMGAGGIDVAMAMAGEPFYVRMPEIWGVKLTGQLPDWVSAKDVILEMLRRHGADGGLNRIIEYHGPGVKTLSAMDRHVIANMGQETGATTTVWPSDDETRRFLRRQNRENDWIEILPDENAEYDIEETINLAELEPLIALPSNPDNVVPVREVAGDELYQAYIGSSANPGYRDFAMAAEMVQGRMVAATVSFDINPTSRQLLENLVNDGHMFHLIRSGARLHQAGCNGCIGMGQAPASGRNSLRTVPRNFPGRSGTREDAVYLCSPETATASALLGRIADPRELEDELNMTYPTIRLPDEPVIHREMLQPPLPPADAHQVELVKGPNIKSLPELDPIPDDLEIPVLLKMGDDISTDEILPAGSDILPYRSNIPAISQFCFMMVDETYSERAKDCRQIGGHAVVGGINYGQGSSREHAALGPRYLGLRVVIAKEFARIHKQNLVNFGVLPVTFTDPDDWGQIEQNDILHFQNLHQQISSDGYIVGIVENKGTTLQLTHNLSARQKNILLAGGVINWIRARQQFQ